MWYIEVMEDKYKQAIEILMKQIGFVWYNDTEWLHHDEAYFRGSEDKMSSHCVYGCDDCTKCKK